MKFISIALIAVALAACGKRETYSIVQVCEGPFMRRDKEYVMKRDSDGQLFYKAYNQVLIKIENGTNLKKICK